VLELLAIIVVAAAGYATGARLGPRTGLAAAAAMLPAVLIAWPGIAWVPVTIVLAGAHLVGRALRSRRLLVAALAGRTAELEATEEELARLAVRHERARVVRELHDVVAHHLAVIVVQAGAGRMAAAGGGAGARERFAAIGDAGARALEEIARLVEAADDAADVRERLEATVARARAAGLRIHVEPVPELGAASATAHAVIQEGLTNALKHAAGASVRVGFGRTGHAVAISVEDDGGAGAGDLAAAGGQLGLAGLRERVAATGGSLAAGPSAVGGWRLEALVPVHSKEGREVAQRG